jgi:hypothetical protein
VVLEIEQAEPAVLIHGQADEGPQLHRLRLGEVLIEAIRKVVVRVEVPDMASAYTRAALASVP